MLTAARRARSLASKGDLYHRLFDGQRDLETEEKEEDFYAEWFQGKQGRTMWRRYSDTVSSALGALRAAPATPHM